MENFIYINFVLLWILMLVNILITVGLARRIARNNIKSTNTISDSLPTSGTVIPEFSGETLDGQQVDSTRLESEFLGLAFISLGCEPCHEQLPQIAKLASYSMPNVLDIIIVTDGSAQDTNTLFEKVKVNTKTIFAPKDKNPFFDDYQIKATPTYLLIDSQNRVISASHEVTIFANALSENVILKPINL